MCVNKVPVFDKHRQQYVYHNCGKCVECLNVKALSNVRLCDKEFELRKCALLVTLKYRNADLPLVEVKRNTHTCEVTTKIELPFSSSRCNIGKYDIGETLTFDKVRYIARTPRVRKYFGRTIDYDYYYTDKEKSRCDKLLLPVISGYVRGTRMAKTFIKPNHFGILFYPDVQNFMKRLRGRLFTWSSKHFYNKTFRNLNDYEKQKIRNEIAKVTIFVCGEYGPQSLRPHFHVIMYFNSTDVAKYAKKNIFSCWSFGSVDVKYSDRGSSKYVAEYVNSLVRVPAILQKPWNKARVLKSIYFGYDKGKELDKDLRKTTFRELREKIYIRNGRFETSSYSLSLESRLFPKTYRFNQSSDYVLLERYKLFGYLSKKFATESVSEIVDKCTVPLFKSDNIDFRVINNKINLHPYLPNETILFDSSNKVSCLERILNISKTFLSNCREVEVCNIKIKKVIKIYTVPPYEMFNLIKKYYNEKNTYTHKEALYKLELDSFDLYYTPECLVNYYDNLCKKDVPLHLRSQNDTLLSNFSLSIDRDVQLVEYALNNDEYNHKIKSVRAKIQEVLASKAKHKQLYDKLKIFDYE